VLRADPHGHPADAHGWRSRSVCFTARRRLSKTGFSPPDPIQLADSPKDATDDSAETEAPRKKRKPIGWSMLAIAVLVAVSVVLVWRRDGLHGVTEILFGDLALFGGILPRVLAGCLLGAFIAEVLPHEKVSRALGPQSGLKGLLIGTAFGAILPGGPFTAYPVAAALLTIGADFGATIAMVVSWTLIGYGRAVGWELPIMGTEFTIWRIALSVPIPIFAGALGRIVYASVYRKSEAE
jgi:uncharacterized membrane protein YraQ (UPF0718 family)